MDLLNYEDFLKIDFRIGEIVSADKVEKSEKLIKMVVDLGDLGKRTVFSGIYKWYKPEGLRGRKTVFVVNVKPKKVMDEYSEAMIFSAEDNESGEVSILLLEKEVKNGSKVF